MATETLKTDWLSQRLPLIMLGVEEKSGIVSGTFRALVHLGPPMLRHCASVLMGHLDTFGKSSLF